jgi:excisionase family DNA binding protein
MRPSAGGELRECRRRRYEAPKPPDLLPGRYPTSLPGKREAGTRGDQATRFRPRELERETGFEPATLSLGNFQATVTTSSTATQPRERTQAGRGATSQPVRKRPTVPNPFAGLRAGPETGAPTIRVLEGGCGRLLTVRDVAARLSCSTATVYKLAGRGELPHVRVANAIRVAASDLEGFIARSRAGSQR